MTSLLSEKRFSELIGTIYDCTLDPSRWDATLAEVKEVFDGESIILSLNDMRSDRLLIDRSVGWTPEWRERRDRHLTEIHARVSEWLAVAPSLDAPFIASRHLPSYDAGVSPYVKDVLAPLGIADVMHLFLMQTPTHVSELVIMHHERYGVATEREIELAALLLPHLRRAVTISRVLDAQAIEHRQLADALDALSCGVVLIDRRGAILHPNRAAERMFCNGGPLRNDRGVLRVRHPSAARELRAAILLAAEDETTIGATGLAVRLTASDEKPVFAHVLPMAGSDRRREMEPAAVAAIFIGAPADERAAAKALATTFELTQAETRFLAGFLSGKTLTEVAAHLDIAQTTAKTHLRNIFAKTGTCRQADLMRLAMQMLPPAR
ncbi:DNA-binding CsgD family transcriptional regulator [Mesorhizobium soli]|uniref:helix-turn-helix transcriptional regulator n=1 Tax=Pseudaminobacter soli (ex Li et al. 2025) TaxID=1295366 RepID=UPI002476BA13|nr:helix-turn-helix transcriptional regulator [Mesorhizobium soli]MDH6234140.1 DNA-binding CsgD family transcriptional regulator [Mesorhizobium soli]